VIDSWNVGSWGRRSVPPRKLTCTLRSDNVSKHKLSSDLRFTSCSTKLLGNPWNSKGRRLLPPVNAFKINLNKLNEYLSKYDHILVKQIGKGIFRKKHSELTWLVLYSPHPCCDPLLVIARGKTFSSMLTVVSFFLSPQRPRSTPPENQHGTWKAPPWKKEKH